MAKSFLDFRKTLKEAAGIAPGWSPRTGPAKPSPTANDKVAANPAPKPAAPAPSIDQQRASYTRSIDAAKTANMSASDAGNYVNASGPSTGTKPTPASTPATPTRVAPRGGVASLPPVKTAPESKAPLRQTPSNSPGDYAATGRGMSTQNSVRTAGAAADRAKVSAGSEARNMRIAGNALATKPTAQVSPLQKSNQVDAQRKTAAARPVKAIRPARPTRPARPKVKPTTANDDFRNNLNRGMGMSEDTTPPQIKESFERFLRNKFLKG